MRTFTVNEKSYKAKDFDFNLVCDLEDMGISLDQIKKKPAGGSVYVPAIMPMSVK